MFSLVLGKLKCDEITWMGCYPSRGCIIEKTKDKRSQAKQNLMKTAPMEKRLTLLGKVTLFRLLDLSLCTAVSPLDLFFTDHCLSIVLGLEPMRVLEVNLPSNRAQNLKRVWLLTRKSRIFRLKLNMPI